MCLSPEISLDVDADRDGVVEKNNPKKVPSYQRRGPGPDLGGGWILQAAKVLPPSPGSSHSTDEEAGARDRLLDTAHQGPSPQSSHVPTQERPQNGPLRLLP